MRMLKFQAFNNLLLMRRFYGVSPVNGLCRNFIAGFIRGLYVSMAYFSWFLWLLFYHLDSIFSFWDKRWTIYWEVIFPLTGPPDHVFLLIILPFKQESSYVNRCSEVWKFLGLLHLEYLTFGI